MKRLMTALILLSSLSQAHATSPELWVAKNAKCVSGTVNPQSDFKAGAMLSGPGVEYVAARDGGKVVKTENEAVFTLPVSGTADSHCQNDGKPTILIVTIQK
jgi:hypothetical protein